MHTYSEWVNMPTRMGTFSELELLVAADTGTVYDLDVSNDSYLLFREFLRAPLQVGAVVPSGLRAAMTMTEVVPDREGATVVELGPGTGALTAVIRQRLQGLRGRQIAIELNPRLARTVAMRWSDVEVVCQDAMEIRQILTSRGLRSADAVVCSLPWTCFSAARQRGILEAIRAALADDGRFATLAYAHALWGPPARRFRHMLHECFDDVEMSRVIWPNVPPAVVYQAGRRRPEARR
jgi:phosphatidylethanolamine/phosphatidyl-N-methylethanolamine N-methyltransferase